MCVLLAGPAALGPALRAGTGKPKLGEDGGSWPRVAHPPVRAALGELRLLGKAWGRSAGRAGAERGRSDRGCLGDRSGRDRSGHAPSGHAPSDPAPERGSSRQGALRRAAPAPPWRLFLAVSRAILTRGHVTRRRPGRAVRPRSSEGSGTGTATAPAGQDRQGAGPGGGQAAGC